MMCILYLAYCGFVVLSLRELMTTSLRAVSQKIHVYLTRKLGRLHYEVFIGSKRILTTTRLDRAHEWIARTLPDHFVFYLVFSQPEIRAKTEALLKVLDLMPGLRNRIGVLVSYALIDQETLNCIKILKEHGVQVMLDSGAFHVLQRKVPLDRYLSWLDKYIEFVNSHIDLFDWVVTADIPCDSRVDPSLQHLPNRRRIEMTIDNTLRIIDRIVDPRKFMIVVQGYYPEEYAYCCELYKRYGIVTARVGVGSLCIRKYSRNAVQEIRQILETVRQHLPAWVKLHAFGLNIRFLKHEEIRSLLSSSDSNSWVYPYCRFSRLVLTDVAGTFIELDLKEATRRFYKIQLTPVTIYKYLILSYIEKLHALGLV